MGSLEELISVAKSLEGKIDGLIAALANGVPATDKPATGTRARKGTETATDKAAAPTVTADQVKTEFERVKALPKAQTPALKKVISDLGFATLAELLTHPEKFDDAMTALKGYETSLVEEPTDDL